MGAILQSSIGLPLVQEGGTTMPSRARLWPEVLLLLSGCLAVDAVGRGLRLGFRDQSPGRITTT